MLTFENLQRVVGMGCRVRIQGNPYGTKLLLDLAKASLQGGGMLTIADAGQLPGDDLMQIAMAGKKNVAFEF